tara:strand:- start:521 stop:1000 length:480 start_codon:yes stop_codon:yes gene_type:complete
MKNLIITVLILSSLKGFSQQLFNGLSVGMTKKEVKTEMKTNDYKNIELGTLKYFTAKAFYGEDKKLNRVFLKPHSIGNGLMEQQAEHFFKEFILLMIEKGYKSDVTNSHLFSHNTTQIFYSEDNSKKITLELISFDNDPFIRFFVNVKPNEIVKDNNNF